MGLLSSYLYRLYRDTNELNKTNVLSLLDRRPEGRLLDCGCGDGKLTVRLGDRAGVAELHGIEAVGERAQTASSRGIQIKHCDLDEGLPYEDNFFDIVHANQLIEHLHSTDNFLKETHRVLKPDGVAIISTNNLASWHNIFSLILGMQPPPAHVSSEVVVGNRLDPKRGMDVDKTEDFHLRIFSFQALKELCEFHGFRVLTLQSTGYYPLPPKLGQLFCRLDRRHGAFLIAKLSPSSVG